MRIDQKEKRLIPHRFPLEGKNINRIAAQKHAETSNERRCPLFVAHLVSTRIEPHHIFNFSSTNSTTLQEFRAPKYRMFAPKLNQSAGEFEQLVLLIISVPVEPADLVVLAVGIIVSAL